MYVQCNVEVCMHNQCCHGNAITIKFYDCVCVRAPVFAYGRALAIWHAYCISSALHSVDIYGLSGCTIFFHVISETA